VSVTALDVVSFNQAMSEAEAKTCVWCASTHRWKSLFTGRPKLAAWWEAVQQVGC
jgi:hypothetical protein